jgi:molybdopterin adenylyltransferase
VDGTGRRGVAVVTVSDGVSRGIREDASGRAVAELLEGAGFDVKRRDVVPDERAQIEGLLRTLADEAVALVVTTGGTGLGPRDVTPEATRAVIEREAPGLAEEIRAAGRGSTPLAALSRGIAGTRGSTLIVNVPGSERGATESLSAILPALPHALDLLAGQTVHGPKDGNAHEHHGEEVVVATAIKVEGNPPCRVGQKMLLGRDGPLGGTLGCAEFDDSAVADAPAILDAGSPQTRTYTHDLGSIEVFLEPVLPRPQLIVFSATPVAAHLLHWAGEAGFDPVLVEPRNERVTSQHRTGARIVASVEQVKIAEDSAAIHTDHDAPGVAESVAVLLRSPARFIGVMGSARHVGPHIEKLRGMGFGDEVLGRIRTPVGIDIGARSAEEIALSILAGVVADRHDAAGGWLDRR